MPNKKRPLKVFLCHAKDDKAKVQKLYDFLRKQGVDVWFSAVDLLPGQDIQVEIPRAVNTSDTILVCLTRNSVDKEGYIQTEIRLAVEKSFQMPEGRIFLIPARLEDCEIPYSMKRYHHVDLFKPGEYSRLMKALQVRATQLQLSNTEITFDNNLIEDQKENNVVDSETENVDKFPPIIEGENTDVKTVISPRLAKRNSKWDAAIVVALIGLVGTISAALLGSPLLEKWFSSTPTATITLTQISTPTMPTNTPDTSVFPMPLPSEIYDSKGVTMRLVPAGEFMMGSNTVASNAQPVHQVYLDDFYIDKYEVTNAQYKVCVNLGACKPLDTTLYYDNVKYANNPVTFVDWHRAVAFCSWREARLPTEAEWEKSARGVEELNFPWGNSIDCSYANYRGANGWCVGDSTPIGSYETGKSIFGVYDMVGNAMEWVSSTYADYPYNVNDGREGLTVSALRVIRGGSWNSREPDVRITVRAYKSPSAAEFDFGFRCAKSALP